MTAFSERLEMHGRAKVKGVWGEFRRQVTDAAYAEEVSGLPPQHKESCKTFKASASTLTRWMRGENKPCVACVRILSELLGDTQLVDARLRDGDATHVKDMRYIISRARGLPEDTLLDVVKGLLPEDLSDRAHREILRLLGTHPPATEFGTREDFEARIHFSAFTESLLRGHLTLTWHGDIPARATVRLVGDTDALSAAFDDERCIYRDAVHVSPTELNGAFGEVAGTPKLRVSRSGGHGVTLTAVRAETPGSFHFENDEERDAHFLLDFVFPYSRRFQSYAVQFGSYAVIGIARILVELDPAVADGPPDHISSIPRSFYTAADGHAYRLMLGLGDPGALLPENTTVVFTWAKR
jgi:hypothetical protein